MRRAIAVGLAALAAGSCTPAYVKTNQSPVLFRIVDINGGAPLPVDVSANGVVLSDSAIVTLAVRPKNPLTPVPQVAMAVFVERYEVRYFRSDGRSTEGVDVPFRISGNITTAVDAHDGTNPSDNVALSVEVVRAQAKLEPPLRNLTSLGGSALIVSMIAEVTIHGRTVAGEAVQDSGRLQIDFADYQ